ncbi:hypothetical protein D9M68_571140 [compost metagenome]
MGGIAVFKHDLLAALGADADDAVGDDADHPDMAGFVDRHAVRIGAFAELGNHCPFAEIAVRRDAEAQQAPAEGFVHVQVRAGGIHTAFVGPVHVLRHDARAMAIVHGDEAVGDVAAELVIALAHRAHADPQPFLAVQPDEIDAGQPDAVDLHEVGSGCAVALHAPDPAVVGQIGDGERTVAQQGEAVGDQARLCADQAGAAARLDVADAAGLVGNVQVARGGAEHALRPVQIDARFAHGAQGKLDDPGVRFAVHARFLSRPRRQRRHSRADAATDRPSSTGRAGCGRSRSPAVAPR